METEGSLPHPQTPATCPILSQINPLLEDPHYHHHYQYFQLCFRTFQIRSVQSQASRHQNVPQWL
jgi:hypothetical protein